MPNWVRNIVEFSGNEEVIARMREEIKSENRVIDFNKILQTPKELEETRYPTKIMTQEEYDLQEERIAKGYLTESEKDWGLSRGLTQELVDEYIEKFGFADWYSWQVYNWDTKWNASESKDYGDSIEFNTAWSNPYSLLVALSNKYPEITFNIRYADEDFGHNVGEYTLKGGEEIYGNIPNGGTYESYLIAIDIQYGEPCDFFDCNTDIFIDLWGDDKEKLGNYLLTMIDIAYENLVLPFEDCQWHKLVLDRFKEKAMTDENFELVAIIQKELDKVK